MNIEELKSKITFHSRDAGYGGQVELTGTLSVSVEAMYYRPELEAYRDSNRALDELKNRIRENISRTIYENRRQEFMKLLHAASLENELDCAVGRCDPCAISAGSVLI